MAAKKTTTKKTATRKASPKKQATGKASSRKTPAKKTPARKAPTKKTSAKAGDRKMSALDAAAKVLGESKDPMTSKGMIEAMARKGYWKSPGGKTPHATLYSGILREINTKGKDARFTKADRGLFTLNK